MVSRPPRLEDESRIDLHTHTRCSDGTDGVDELVAGAARAGLDVIALTDHDTTAGWDEAAQAARRHGVSVVPGIEVSTEFAALSVHVLALLPDPSDSTELGRQMDRARRSREGRARRMVERLAEDHPITWDDVQAQVAGEYTTVGRPHIADALVAAGVVDDRSAAFTDLLSPSSPYYERYWAPDPAAAVRAIVAAGGVSIAAHPGSVTRDGTAPEDLLEAMVAAGLSGLEVDHREHDDVSRARLRDFARAHDLLETGGSDYHGAGKPNRLGENLTRPSVLAALLERATSRTEVLSP
jgi:predicted metal-dependent phosphoesterase TrpH